MKKKDKDWAPYDPSMPKDLTTFRKAFSSSVQGFHLLNEAEAKQEAKGETVASAGRIVQNPFQGPVPMGERVDFDQQQEYQTFMMRAQAVVNTLEKLPLNQ